MSQINVNTITDEAGTGPVTVTDGAVVNRQTTDGTIIDLRKDGTTVGSIASENGYTKVISGNGTAGSGLGFYNYKVSPVNPNGSVSDNAIDLGEAANRFKDLYLSGGVYLGGTGSANYLSEYEEGTWTPAWVPAAGSITNSYPTGFYQKSGSFVHAMGYWGFGSAAGVSAGDKIQLGGLPFASTSSVFGQGQAGTVSLHPNYGWTSAANQPYPTTVIQSGGITKFSIFSSDLYSNANPSVYQITFSDMAQASNYSQIVAHIFYKTV